MSPDHALATTHHFPRECDAQVHDPLGNYKGSSPSENAAHLGAPPRIPTGNPGLVRNQRPKSLHGGIDSKCSCPGIEQPRGRRALSSKLLPPKPRSASMPPTGLMPTVAATTPPFGPQAALEVSGPPTATPPSRAHGVVSSEVNARVGCVGGNWPAQLIVDPRSKLLGDQLTCPSVVFSIIMGRAHICPASNELHQAAKILRICLGSDRSIALHPDAEARGVAKMTPNRPRSDLAAHSASHKRDLAQSLRSQASWACRLRRKFYFITTPGALETCHATHAWSP
jgi:hypothetical protein